MTFFVTSAGSGKGADLGGLEGADKICQSLAQAAGAGGKTWRAYLSTQGAGGVNARDRIGKGPWTNAKGVVIAKDVAELHGDEQPDQADRAHREGRRGQRPRRHAEHARHPHRLAARRHEVSRHARHDVRQLDQERGGRRDGRACRPHGARRQRAGEILELVAPVARSRTAAAARTTSRARAATASCTASRRTSATNAAAAPVQRRRSRSAKTRSGSPTSASGRRSSDVRCKDIPVRRDETSMLMAAASDCDVIRVLACSSMRSPFDDVHLP